jgi:hypothetical protein
MDQKRTEKEKSRKGKEQKKKRAEKEKSRKRKEQKKKRAEKRKEPKKEERAAATYNTIPQFYFKVKYDLVSA